MTVVAQQISNLFPYIYGQVAPFINNLSVSDVVATLLTTQKPRIIPGLLSFISPTHVTP